MDKRRHSVQCGRHGVYSTGTQTLRHNYYYWSQTRGKDKDRRDPTKRWMMQAMIKWNRIHGVRPAWSV